MKEDKTSEDKGFRHLVRILNTDLKGEECIIDALRKIKGISFSFSNMICKAAKIDPKKKIGNVTDKEVEILNYSIKNAKSYAPEWMLNRRKDIETGESRHLLTSDLDFTREIDIRNLKKIKCYRGVRHIMGLPVRGQRTRSNFRKNKGRGPGVIKKKSSRSGRV